METIIDKAPCGLFAFSDEATVILVNDCLAALLHTEKESIIGHPVENIFTLPTRIFFQTHLFPMVKLHGHAEEIFITLLSSTGQHLPVLLNAKREQWEGQTITYCACIVVPNRKKFEDELVAARKAAEKALSENSELIKAKSELEQQTRKLDRQVRLVKTQHHELQQFNHVITHNLKEPLRKILMYTGKLESESDAPSLVKLRKSNEQMKAVVLGLQQYVWLNEKTNQFGTVDLNLVVQMAAEQVRKELGEHLFTIQHGELAQLEADPEQLQLLMYHLFTNAIKFRRGEKAFIQINSTIMKQNRLGSVENEYQYIDFVCIEVLDEGIGFDPHYSEQIFELFRKLHFSEGQGLGLALCKKITDNHQGFIESESEVNRYAKIKAWFPLQQSGHANE